MTFNSFEMRIEKFSSIVQGACKTALAVILIFLYIPLSSARCDTTVTADDLIYLTENFPPHNFVKEGNITGASVEILELIWKRLDCKKTTRDIKVIPWARGMKQLENEPNIVLFGMGYSVERIKKFQWVGPYYHHALSLIAKKEKNIKIHHIDDAKSYLIGVVREDVGNQFLLNLDFSPEKLDLSSDVESLFNKINYNRFNLICYAGDAFLKFVSEHHPDKTDDFEPVFEVSNMRSGFGFSKTIPKELIQQFQTALDELISDGSVDGVLHKFHMK